MDENPGQLFWTAVQPVQKTISIYDGPDVFLADFERAPEIPRLLFAGDWCLSEVVNGGLQQFFGNSTGVLAPEAVACYRAIGMPELAAVVETAMAWFGPVYSRDRTSRRNALQKHAAEHPSEPDPFDALDREYYRLYPSESGGFMFAADRYVERSQRLGKF